MYVLCVDCLEDISLIYIVHRGNNQGVTLVCKLSYFKILKWCAVSLNQDFADLSNLISNTYVDTNYSN